MKPCPHCGKELPQEMQFCPYCMEKLMTETPVGEVPLRPGRGWLWLAFLIAVLLLLLCGLWLWRPWQSPPDPERESIATVNSSSVTTTTTAVAVHPSATQTTNLTQTEATATTHATTSTIGTDTTSRATTAVCAAGHDWQSVTQTVHVDEVGHYETKMVGKQVTLFRCALCYEDFDVSEDYYAHFDAQHNGDSLEIVFRDRYETFAEYREVEEQQWVVDTPAYDETITVGRRCRVCGKTEDNQ